MVKKQLKVPYLTENKNCKLKMEINKMEKISRKSLVKIAEIAMFGLGFYLICRCFGDGIYNGRLMLGLALFVGSFYLEHKYSK